MTESLEWDWPPTKRYRKRRRRRVEILQLGIDPAKLQIGGVVGNLLPQSEALARARLVFIETIEEFPTGLSEAKRVPEPHPAGQEFALALIRANFGSLSLLASL
jgi:hypothetical protein